MSRLRSVVQMLLDVPALPGINGMTPDKYYAFRSFSHPQEGREYFDGVSTDEIKEFESARFEVPLQVSGIVTSEQRKNAGVLVQSGSVIWVEIVRRLHKNWEHAFEIAPREWEEIIAGAFDKAGFDEVILTPRSGDFGRDVIAVKKGFGSIKIIGSVKAFKRGHLVKHDDVRALLGVLAGEQDASKAIITTTSDFAPRVRSDPFIKPFLPTRLELMNGDDLQRWLTQLSSK